MAKAQEELKHESVEASAGGGMVTVKVSGELEVLELRIDPDARRSRGRRAAPGHGAGRHQRGPALGAGAGGVEDGRGAPAASAAWACPACRRRDPGLCSPPPINRLITELARLPGIGQRTAQRLAFHILRVSDEEALALADAIREVKEKVGQCEICFNLATEATCRICQDERRDGAPDLRGRGAQRRDPDRAHQRVRRPLPRAGRRAVADRRRGPRGPAHRRAARARVRPTASARSWWPPTPPPPARPPRSTSPTPCASARRRSRSPAWPAACRWARTWSTPTRSRWAALARPSRAVASPRPPCGGVQGLPSDRPRAGVSRGLEHDQRWIRP